ncbi:MAG: hypothetical protein AB8G05_15960 [Oligoflexales bacterium]
MKRIAVIFIACAFLTTSSKTCFAGSPESEFERDYRTVKSIIYTGLTLAAVTGLAAMCWGVLDYAQDFEEQGQIYADSKAKFYRGASEPGNRIGKKMSRTFYKFGKNAINKDQQQRMSEETRALHRIPFINTLYGVGYGNAPGLANKLNDLDQYFDHN